MGADDPKDYLDERHKDPEPSDDGYDDELEENKSKHGEVFEEPEPREPKNIYSSFAEPEEPEVQRINVCVFSEHQPQEKAENSAA